MSAENSNNPQFDLAELKAIHEALSHMPFRQVEHLVAKVRTMAACQIAKKEQQPCAQPTPQS